MSGPDAGEAEPPAAVVSVDRIDAVLPQTQCTRCGYPDCRSYAQAIADGKAGIDRCPPGGAEGIARLAAVTGLHPTALDPAYGREGPRQLAVIDESWCIGCTLCLDACPTDAIMGRNKRMHTVVALHCTGCELCVPVCPVDCIAMVPVTGTATGWHAWSHTQAEVALQRYRRHASRAAEVGGKSGPRRLQPMEQGDEVPSPVSDTVPVTDTEPTVAVPAVGAPVDPKRALIEAAMRRARALRS